MRGHIGQNSPGIAPRGGKRKCSWTVRVGSSQIDLPASEVYIVDLQRDRSTCLCAQGGLTGVPQVNLPGATVDGAPIGLSIIGGRASDALLIAVAQAMQAMS